MSDVRVKPPHVQDDVGGPGLGETDPERPGGGSGGRAQRGLASSPAAIQWGAGAAGTSLRAGAALPTHTKHRFENISIIITTVNFKRPFEISSNHVWGISR